MSTSIIFETLREFCSTLNFAERKALITLARSQSIPEPDTSPILFSKVRILLDRLVTHPPYVSLSEPFVPAGDLILKMLSSPLTCGLLIVFSLGVSLTDDQVRDGKDESFTKELLATQTIRLPESWNWKAIISPSRYPREVIHPMFPYLSPTQRQFSLGVNTLYNRYQRRTILPHYSKRGISSETSSLLLRELPRFDRYRVCKHGNPRSFHHRIDRKNVSSKDIVHHYVRTGNWISGRVEMKQRWYPSGLLPRTYFSWGGRAIALSSYLRNFFNDLGDSFAPTDRHNRVQPSWLQHPNRTSSGGFMFYDLTSFTSWFHEQESFLRAIAERFKGVTVFLVGEDLTLTAADIGDMVLDYIDGVNSYPEFFVGSSVSNKAHEGLDYRHWTAGFLGVPGNLITCTIPHGLAIASLVDNIRELQVPGDDVGAAYHDDDHMRDIGTCASTLGFLQMDKVFNTPGISLYLKRLVIDLFDSMTLSPMLIFPLLPYLIDPQGSYRSNQFRLPDPAMARARAASVLVSFRRDFWNMTKGNCSDEAKEIIFLFIKMVHSMVKLPLNAIFQGRVYGEDTDEDIHLYPDISVKFDANDLNSLNFSPDIQFASRFITRMTIRLTNEVDLTPPFKSLKEGDSIIVNRGKKWTFLEDMGYVKIAGIPGEKIELVGSDARDAYLFASEPPLRCVEVLSDLSTLQLVSVGILQDAESEVFEGRDDYGSRHVDVNTRSWRYRKYVDLDDPRSAGMYGMSRDWVVDKLPMERSSLSPEPQDASMYY